MLDKTDIEIIAMAQQFRRDQLLNMLYDSEKALNLLWPACEQCVKLKEEKENKQKTYESYIDKSGSSWIVAPLVVGIITAVIGLFYFWSGGFLSFLLGCLFWTALIITVFVIFGSLPPSQKQIQNAEDEYRKASEQYAAAENYEQQIKQQYNVALGFRQIVCPPECANPRYLRIFINFLETGRADNLKEAQNLFAEYLYRERMENLAVDQANAARAAQYAAEDAAAAARQASVSANNAENQARQNYYRY